MKHKSTIAKSYLFQSFLSENITCA